MLEKIYDLKRFLPCIGIPPGATIKNTELAVLYTAVGINTLQDQGYISAVPMAVPSTWADFVASSAEHVFPSAVVGQATSAVSKLSMLLAVYNSGWVPDWENDITNKFVLYFRNGLLTRGVFHNSSRFLAFKDYETRELFLNNFRELIELAKPLL